jgi:hypothetical protein
MKKVLVSLVTMIAIAACSSPNDSQGALGAGGAGIPGADEVSADNVEVVQGIPDRDRDPAVVAIDIGGTALCTGSLIARNVVLTARHCVARTVENIECPASAPQVGADHTPSSLHILVGDDASVAREVARGKDIVAPKGWSLCDADIALIVLDRAVEGIAPLPVRRAGVALGDHVRAVGYGREGDGAPAGIKLLRDHVKVVETGDFEFTVGEATCQGDSGGPAIDESSGEIVGVVSRGGPTCDGADVHNIYTRADVYLPLIEQAIRSAGQPGNDQPGSDDDADAGIHAIADAGKTKDAGAKPQKPANDMGGACRSGKDCAAGVCVREHGKQYCSRACGAGDRCPTHFGCQRATGGAQVCVAK